MDPPTVYPPTTVDQACTKQCSTCKRHQPLASFQGKRGFETKQCAVCREDDSRRKSQPEIRAKRKEQAREKQYSKKYYEKKIAEPDAAAFRERKNKRLREWRANNKEHCSAWAKGSVNTRMDAIRRQATKKGYAWSLTDEEATGMMTSPCWYCGYLHDTFVNGIDRQDNRVGYEAANCVPACKTCNFMKTCLDVTTFLQRCTHIAGGAAFPDAWPDHASPSSYTSYAQRAADKDLPFELTRGQFEALRGGECVYCGKAASATHLNGVDRLDNNRGYVTDNVASCCTECNVMKRGLSQAGFLEACRRVAARWPSIPARDPSARDPSAHDPYVCVRSISKRV